MKIATLKDDSELTSDVINDAVSDIENTKKFRETGQTNIDRFTDGETQKKLTGKTKELEKRESFLNEEMRMLYNESEKLGQRLSVDSVNYLKHKIAREEYKKYQSEKPDIKYDENDLDTIRKRIETRLDAEMNDIREELGQNALDFRVITQSKNTIAFEFFLVNTSIELSQMLWHISNQTYFNTASCDLSEEQVSSFKNDFNAVMDTIDVRINQAQEINGAGTKKQAFQLELFINGYADSQGSEQTNNILSENRGKEIKNIFLPIFNSKVSRIEDGFITFKEPRISVIGKGETIPNLSGEFREEGEADQNRRLVIMQCVLLPVE